MHGLCGQCLGFSKRRHSTLIHIQSTLLLTEEVPLFFLKHRRSG